MWDQYLSTPTLIKVFSPYSYKITTLAVLLSLQLQETTELAAAVINTTQAMQLLWIHLL
jgi:hypothetical protein